MALHFLNLESITDDLVITDDEVIKETKMLQKPQFQQKLLQQIVAKKVKL